MRRRLRTVPGKLDAQVFRPRVVEQEDGLADVLNQSRLHSTVGRRSATTTGLVVDVRCDRAD
jgi:hypothetical protein